MNYDKSQKYDLKTMSKIMDSIADSYLHSLATVVKGFKKENSELSDSNVNNELASHHEIVDGVEKVFERMDPVSKEIINNDFFRNDRKFWWIKIYPVSTYYRLKNTALREFLEMYIQ